MTEHEWLTSEDPAAILRLRRTECCGCFWIYNGYGTVSLCRDCVPCGQCDNGPILPVTPFSNRKLRLWVEACRAYWQRDDRAFGNYDLDSPSGLTTACENWSRCHPTVMPIDPLPMRAHLLRDIIGNPFRPAQFPSGAPVEAKCVKCGGALAPLKRDRQPMLSACLRCGQVNGHWFDVLKPGPCPWLTTDVLSIAQAAYDERLDDGTLDLARLAVLSDALEEAGCTDDTLLSHLRSPGPHVRGCWAVDLILGKE